MKLNTNTTYIASSNWYSIQVNLPQGETALLKIKVPGATSSTTQEFTESGLYSDFIGHCELTVENDNCEFAISPKVTEKDLN